MNGTGGPPDFESYVASRRAQLRRTAYLLCGDWDRAEDIVQDTLTRLYVHWRRASSADSVDAYVRRSLVNAYLSEGRRPWRRERPTEVLPETEVGDATGRIVAEDEVQAALRRLPRRQRAVVVLRYFDDLSEAETARLLGISTGTVKSQTSKALAALRVDEGLDRARTEVG